MGMYDLVAALFERQFVAECETCATKAFDACNGSCALPLMPVRLLCFAVDACRASLT